MARELKFQLATRSAREREVAERIAEARRHVLRILSTQQRNPRNMDRLNAASVPDVNQAEVTIE